MEVNEPLMMPAWPLLVLLTCAARLRRLLGAPRIEIVSYAIENGTIPEWFAARTRLPERLGTNVAMTVARLIAGQFTRLAFGTHAAAENYRRILGQRRFDAILSREFSPLEPKCGECVLEKIGGTVVFLGSFESRKGFDLLVDAWPDIADASPGARLILVGKGPLLALAKELQCRPDVSMVQDPSRNEVHDQLRRADVLVLLSQPSRYWKEQIGLPILEGLSHGCTVVSTSETGIASWLQRSGHHVVTIGTPRRDVAGAISAAVARPIAADRVVKELPEGRGGRERAAAWLYREQPENDEF
ncbi:glycosyltransferase family 4 protein [Agromyces sp. NPDC004153]